MFATSWYDLNFTFHLAIVTPNIKFCPGYISQTVRSEKLILAKDIGERVKVCVLMVHLNGVILT